MKRKKKKKRTHRSEPKAQRKEDTKTQSDLVVCFGAKVFSPFDDRSTRGTEGASAGDVHMASAPDAGESRDL